VAEGGGVVLSINIRLVLMICWILDIPIDALAIAGIIARAEIAARAECERCGLRGCGECATCRADALLERAWGRREVRA
jgi:hypothetical protein